MPSTPDQPDHPDDDSLGESFWSVARQLRHRSMQTLAPFGITPGQNRAISVLLRHGPMRLGDLAEHLHIAPRSATEVADALEERGLIARSPDPADRRATVITLTTGGEHLGAQVRQARSAEADAFFSTLSPEDREALTRILRSLR